MPYYATTPRPSSGRFSPCVDNCPCLDALGLLTCRIRLHLCCVLQLFADIRRNFAVGWVVERVLQNMLVHGHVWKS